MRHTHIKLTERGDGLSSAPAEPARRRAPRGRGESTTGARSGGLRTIETVGAQTVANTLHIMAKTCYCPWDLSLVPKLERRAEALAGTFKAQCVVNTLWAYATMGLEPRAGLMRELEGRMGPRARRGHFSVIIESRIQLQAFMKDNPSWLSVCTRTRVQRHTRISVT